ncbi:endo-beta-N-acetylglucosaminidase [Enterococcus mediterraneensis]|uniref:endo-beta-N-acetylglucosaminidase n=1 Tax=Enterococcus mediterraneensis TaxID=2364791 RepID=UPI000F059BA0|nr:discoidin domain-containing protein [Enterococcus mediterraneensis]
MKHIRLKSVSVLVLLAALTVGAAGCQTQTQGQAAKNESKIVYSETEEAKLDRGMDNQPQASYWFPEDLLKWDFAKDPDAKYNVSTTPLAKQVDKKSLAKVNDTQDPDMQVVALSIMNASTSGNAPRGINTFDSNVFSSWQYIDKMVYWGGSSGEGIIVPPSADVIDAAHKNGVPILGTIFFPQTAHGGKIEWLSQFLEKDKDGNFPIVDKLVEVADQYGFDGWFINQETDNEVTSFDEAAENKGAAKEDKATSELNKKHADLMQELIKAYKAKVGDKQDLMWYDSMTKEGKMDWQNALTDKNDAFLVDADMNPVADNMFLNFWWNTDELAKDKLLEKSAAKAKELGIDPYELFAGIDVQANGFMTPTRWSLFTDKNNKPYTSLGLYVPDWTYFSGGTPDDIQERENTFWVNGQADPTLSVPVKDGEWPGVSTYAVEQTAVTETPFVTNFNLGNGYNYFIDGKKVSGLDWNNRSLQDILPTYRWIFQHGKGNDLNVSMDYTDAFQGGNSLKMRGTMNAKVASTVKLYAADLKLDKGTVFTTTAKASEKTALDLILTFSDGKEETFKGDKQVKNGWTTVTYNVSKAAGKEIKAISYSIESAKTSDVYELNFGQIAVTGKESKNDLSVKNVKIEDSLFDEEESNFAGIRLTWDAVKDDDFSHYEIYRINKDDSRSFVGATPAANHYINALERNDDTNKTNFVVVPVDIWGNRGKASEKITLKWPNNAIPKATFKASRTLIAPGDSVTFTNASSSNTDSVKWEFEGGNIVDSTDDAPVVTYDKAGTYAVKLTAKNKAGETPVEIKEFITVSDDAKGDLALLSSGVKTEASGFTNDNEAPQMAVDGKLDTKWCATGTPPHEITLDLGAVKTISEVHLAHAEAGGESPDMNTKAYSILVSEDGKEFTQVARIINNTASESVDTFSAVKARYVRLSSDKPTQGSDTAVRIYEMGVYGLK